MAAKFRLKNTVDGRIPIREQYTTGEIAFLLGVAYRTATAMIDNGTIPGFKLPMPTSRGFMPRRVRHAVLMKFIEKNPEYKFITLKLVDYFKPAPTKEELECQKKSKPRQRVI